MHIAIAQIEIKRAHLRRDLNPEIVDQLARSMQSMGQLQPILVRAIATDRYELIAGRTRLAAASQLGWLTISCEITTHDEHAEIMAAEENLRRTNLTPLEEADYVHLLHEQKGMSLNEIAERTGHGQSWVRDRAALHALPEELQHAVHDRVLGISAALLLSQITDATYRTWLIHCAKTNGCTIHQAEAWWLDWKARMMLSPRSEDGSDPPQPPPLPPQPGQPCFLCDTPTPKDYITIVRVCSDCVHEVQKGKAEGSAFH